ncbi:MAG: hypothetical protein KAX05_14650 [Bacteroidales bacterium]|nr:hypothetical protein [Bacteroidales bacterium]
MAPVGRVGQPGPGNVSGKELEITDYKLSKAIANNYELDFDLGIPV